MPTQKIVTVSKSQGPVLVEIKAKYITHGKFQFAIQTETGYSKIFTGQFGDNIPDVFMLPYKPEDLPGHPLFLIGNFAPGSPDSEIISFDINIIQNQQKIDSVEHNQNNQTYISVNTIINFAVKE